MSEYAVNLIRDTALPARRRRNLFLLMVAYLACSGALLVVAVASASSQFALAAREYSDARTLDGSFRREYDTHLTIAQFGRRLEGESVRARIELEQIRGILTSQTIPSRVVMGLATALPAPAYIRGLKMDVSKRNLFFDVAVPLRLASQPEFAASHLISLWGRDPSLAREVRRIEATASERQNIDMLPCVIWKFSAKLGAPET